MPFYFLLIVCIPGYTLSLTQQISGLLASPPPSLSLPFFYFFSSLYRYISNQINKKVGKWKKRISVAAAADNFVNKYQVWKWSGIEERKRERERERARPDYVARAGLKKKRKVFFLPPFFPELNRSRGKLVRDSPYRCCSVYLRTYEYVHYTYILQANAHAESTKRERERERRKKGKEKSAKRLATKEGRLFC